MFFHGMKHQLQGFSGLYIINGGFMGWAIQKKPAMGYGINGLVPRPFKGD